MKNSEMTVQDSLEIITKMIETRKSKWRDNGFILRFWGWLVLIASVGHYTLSVLELYQYIWFAWGLTILGAIYTPFHVAKIKKKKQKAEFLDKVSGFIWWTFAFNAFIIGFVFTYFWGHLTTGMILVLLGIAASIDGIIIRFKPMIIGGIITNLLGIFSLFWAVQILRGVVESQNFLILLVGAGICLTNIIPGYVLKKEFKSNNENHG